MSIRLLTLGICCTFILTGCFLPKIPIAQNKSKTVYQDAQGNKIESNANGDKTDVKITGENGDVNMSASKDGDFTKTGLSKYPNEIPSPDGNGFFEMTTDGVNVVQLSAMTNDPPAKVASYYEKEMTVKSKSEMNNSFTLMGNTKDRDILLTISVVDNKTVFFVQSQQKLNK